MIFKNRKAAGQKLAGALKAYKNTDTLVLAIPRGGLVVGAEIAQSLNLKLDLIISRKIGAPHNPEIAVGAVTGDRTIFWAQELLKRLGLKESDLIEQIEQEIKEIKRRMQLYRKSSYYPHYKQKNIILVDDGIATGYTVMAAIDAIKKMFDPDHIILAVPVAPPEVIDKLKIKVEQVKCLCMPEEFYAVGQFYDNFEQTSDQEVLELMKSLAKQV